MEKKNDKKALIAIIGVLVVALVIGVTYAFITITLQGTKENSITGGSLKLTLNDALTENGDGDIAISDAFPVIDSVGKTGKAYQFNLTSTGDKDASYTVFLDDDYTGDAANKMADESVKAYLTDGSDNELLAPTTIDQLGQPTTARTVDGKTVSSRILYSGVLEHGRVATFILRLWIADTAGSEVMGKQYATKVSVDAVQVPEYAITINNTLETMETVSQAVFKGASPVIQVTAGTGTPTVSCTNGVTATATTNATDSTKLDISFTNVTAHTVCTVTY